jgi:hypothetical protein
MNHIRPKRLKLSALIVTQNSQQEALTLSFERPKESLAKKSRPLHPNCPPGVLSISFIVNTADRPKIARFGCENFNSSSRQLLAVGIRQTGNSRLRQISQFLNGN